ncbi:B3 domain-containing protein Os06g0112300-like isoform X2 [Salvia splendens]|uniref:B3 domain-containing protein Os06g0112300-like isoform X2 n=1 Tax=Salvia splendens TaxID=180675 RepID=UPI001C27098F|nr:B3 domain-containing protein Os06g0112300-like isoform X2 [Salvia splendens]
MSSSTKDKEVCEGNTGGDGVRVGVGVGCCLSGNKDFFDVILSNSHRPPAHILTKLPSVKVPLVLRHGDKQWQMMYLGNDSRPRFECAGWKIFVNDNNLKEGDACIFEVMESSPQILKLDVVVIRNTMDLPPALLSKIQSKGRHRRQP